MNRNNVIELIGVLCFLTAMVLAPVGLWLKLGIVGLLLIIGTEASV